MIDLTGHNTPLTVRVDTSKLTVELIDGGTPANVQLVAMTDSEYDAVLRLGMFGPEIESGALDAPVLVGGERVTARGCGVLGLRRSTACGASLRASAACGEPRRRSLEFSASAACRRRARRPGLRRCCPSIGWCCRCAARTCGTSPAETALNAPPGASAWPALL